MYVFLSNGRDGFSDVRLATTAGAKGYEKGAV